MNTTDAVSRMGVYIHIPFCRSKCVYCDFYSLASIGAKEELLHSMCEEIAMRAGEWKNFHAATVYMGGGTPSLLSGDEISRLMQTVRDNVSLSPTAEITMEVNPDDVTPSQVLMWKHSGVNRISVGVQSFHDETLKKIGRRHTGEKALRALDAIHEAGIENTTLDIIYGIPGRSDEILADDMKKAVGTGVKHISAYALTVEEGTVLDVMIRRGTFPPVDEEQSARQYDMVCDMLGENGYEHYEVSNFAKVGYRSRHNTAYWQRIPYMGIGPAAHSFCGDTRRWNVASVGKYMEKIKENAVYWEEEKLQAHDVHNEMVMTSLRRKEGLDLKRMRDTFGRQAERRILLLASRYMDAGLMVREEDALRFTRAGIFLSDGIEADFFLTEEEMKKITEKQTWM